MPQIKGLLFDMTTTTNSNDGTYAVLESSANFGTDKIGYQPYTIPEKTLNSGTKYFAAIQQPFYGGNPNTSGDKVLDTDSFGVNVIKGEKYTIEYQPYELDNSTFSVAKTEKGPRGAQFIYDLDNNSIAYAVYGNSARSYSFIAGETSTYAITVSQNGLVHGRYSLKIDGVTGGSDLVSTVERKEETSTTATNNSVINNIDNSINNTVTQTFNITVNGDGNTIGDIGTTAFDKVGSGNADTITGNANDFKHDKLRGGAGNDTILGYRGADVLMGDSGDDLIRGSQGMDVIIGGDGNDQLFGGIGHNQMFDKGGNGTGDTFHLAADQRINKVYGYRGDANADVLSMDTWDKIWIYGVSKSELLYSEVDTNYARTITGASGVLDATRKTYGISISGGAYEVFTQDLNAEQLAGATTAIGMDGLPTI